LRNNRRYNKYIFNKFSGPDYAVYDRTNIIVGSKFIDYFVTKDGAKYKVDNNCSNYILEATYNEYDWSDLKSDDIVLEFGATIGDQTIRIAKKVKKVYAVEPMYTNELIENIKLNRLFNVTVISLAVGDGENTVNISHNSNIKTNILSYKPSEIISRINDKITFMKCDIDGGEWYIKPDDLKRIKRIEMEVHPNMYPYEKYNPNLIPYIKDHYNVKITPHKNGSYILHAYEKVSK